MATNNNTFNISNVNFEIIGNGNTKKGGLFIILGTLIGGAIAITACDKKDKGNSQ